MRIVVAIANQQHITKAMECVKVGVHFRLKVLNVFFVWFACYVHLEIEKNGPWKAAGVFSGCPSYGGLLAWHLFTCMESFVCFLSVLCTYLYVYVFVCLCVYECGVHVYFKW